MNSILRDWFYDFARNDWFLKYNEDSKSLPYNILAKKNKDGGAQYFIEVACAGYGKEDIDVGITTKYGVNFLVIKTTSAYYEANSIINDSEIYYKYHGIKQSPFTFSFELGNYTKVVDVEYKNGILKIELTIDKPEDDGFKKLEIK